jgi:hypothetical protein
MVISSMTIWPEYPIDLTNEKAVKAKKTRRKGRAVTLQLVQARPGR